VNYPPSKPPFPLNKHAAAWWDSVYRAVCTRRTKGKNIPTEQELYLAAELCRERGIIQLCHDEIENLGVTIERDYKTVGNPAFSVLNAASRRARDLEQTLGIVSPKARAAPVKKQPKGLTAEDVAFLGLGSKEDNTNG
jgi:phage terminase small subunit